MLFFHPKHCLLALTLSCCCSVDGPAFSFHGKPDAAAAAGRGAGSSSPGPGSYHTHPAWGRSISPSGGRGELRGCVAASAQCMQRCSRTSPQYCRNSQRLALHLGAGQYAHMHLQSQAWRIRQCCIMSGCCVMCVVCSTCLLHGWPPA
jgi:hypothetical protein